MDDPRSEAGPREVAGAARSTRALRLVRLAARNLRNLESVDLELGPRLTVLSGDNGAGKTSLLEAVYFVATSRSFRATKLGELVRHGTDVASVRATFEELVDLSPRDPEAPRGDVTNASASAGEGVIETREQSAAVRASGGACALRIDGQRPRTLAAYATRSPVVAFHAGEIALSSGPAPSRRSLVDRVALFVDPPSATARARYSLALRSRQRVLERAPRGLAGSANHELDAFEALAAEHGAALTRAREKAVALLVPEAREAFRSIASPALGLAMRYERAGSTDVEAAARALRDGRPRDAARGSATFGPHRDDLSLELNGRPARLVASQGQHRALTLALKSAELAAIAAATGLEPIFLLDDVSSELDASRTAALFAFLAVARGQLVLTTTRPELITDPRGQGAAERVDVALENGSIRRLK